MMKKLKFSKLANYARLGERTFLRIFKRATGNSPKEYIKRARVEYEKNLLEEGSKNITEVSYESGT